LDRDSDPPAADCIVCPSKTNETHQPPVTGRQYQSTYSNNTDNQGNHFYFPKEYVPYLPHILGLEDIDLCVENSTNIVDAASRKQHALAVLIACEGE
jgi:hypothetical protein